MDHSILIFTALIFMAFPAIADDFIVHADSEAAVQETMHRAMKLPATERQRFVSLSQSIMFDLMRRQAKEQWSESEMDAELSKIMHGKTLDELEEYVVFYIED